MERIQKIFSTYPLAHHAYGIESSQKLTQEFVDFFHNDQYSYIFHKNYDSFKINDAREIKRLQSEKTEHGSLFILEFSLINIEAQNTLLKVLEEPTPHTYFILVFPYVKKLLPTLQSRLEVLRLQSVENTNIKISAHDFLAKNLQDRFVANKKYTDVKNKEGINKTDLMLFLDQLELTVKKTQKYKQGIFHDIFKAREYLDSKGASNKMILDMMSMSLEQNKK